MDAASYAAHHAYFASSAAAFAAAADADAAYYAAYYAVKAVSYVSDYTLVSAEHAAQADILRKYFPANEIARMVREEIK